MVQLIVLVAAGLLGGSALAGDLANVGEPITLEGRIDQIDRHGSEPSEFWLRTGDDRPALVRGSFEANGLLVGDRVRTKGIRGEDHVQVARDGRVHRYTLVLATGPPVPVSATAFPAWMFVVLPLLLAALLVLALTFGRRQVRTRPPRLSGRGRDLESGWSTLEPSDLPADPIDALAELSRRADEGRV